MSTVRVSPPLDTAPVPGEAPPRGAASPTPSLVEQQSAIEAQQQALDRKPLVMLVQTLATAAVMALIGALSVWAGIAWLVASLGPSAMMQALSSEQRTASMYNTCLGQLIGEAAGFIGVFAVAAAAPPLMSGHPLTWDRVAAVAIAFVLMVPTQILLKAKHPPGAAVALLLALGIEPATWHTAWVMIVGIIMVTLFGEVARILITRVKHGPSAARRMLATKP
jgi:hypothetical protein